MVTSATPTKMANTTICNMFCSTLACKGLVGTMRTICFGSVDSEGAAGVAATGEAAGSLGHLQVAAQAALQARSRCR